jgi:hypothetical protein
VSTTSPEVGQVSPDRQFRWDGEQWVPLAAGYREPTSWTRPLQLVAAAYLALGTLYSIITTALFLNTATIGRTIRASSAGLSGDQVQQAVNFSVGITWLVVGVLAVISLLLAAGSFLGWRWAFWVTLVWLGLSAVGVLSNLNAIAHAETQPLPVGVLVGSLILSLIALAIFIGCLVAAIRYGPWAMRKPGTTT